MRYISLKKEYIKEYNILIVIFKRLQTGGSIIAAKLACQRGWAINIGGGFHHCSSDRGGGFCPYADVTLLIKHAFKEVDLGIGKVMIIDLDAHQVK